MSHCTCRECVALREPERCTDCDEALDADGHCAATRECETCGDRVHASERVEVDGCYECLECHAAYVAEQAAEAMDGDHETALASVYGGES